MERMIIARCENDVVLYLERDLRVDLLWARLVVMQGDILRISANLPSRVQLPEWALEKDADGLLFLSTNAVRQEVIKRRKIVKAELVDALRPLESIHITWNSDNTFLDLTSVTNGEVKLLLAQWLLGEAQADSRIAEFSVHSTLAVSGVPGVQATTSFSCVLRLQGPPRLRLDLDDLNFSFPEFDFPQLDFNVPLAWPMGVGASRIFDRFKAIGNAVTVTVTPNTAAPLLAIDLSSGLLRWALVQTTGTIDWTNVGPQLAVFGVTLTADAGNVTIANLKVANLGSGLLLTHDDPLGQLKVVADGKLSGRLGPLEYLVSGLNVTMSWLATASDRVLTADVQFDRLQLRLTEDPQTAIAFKGQVQLTPSATRILSLDLIEPYPIKLVASAGQALLRGARSVATLLASLEGPDVNASRLEKLLEILGKFAAAIARTALFVGEAIVDAANAAASLLGQALNALSEGIAAILSRLKSLVPSDGGALPMVQVEVRLGLDPLELRQILVTQRTALTKELKFDGMGFCLKLPDAWRPGLLLDFVDNPGAYLVMSREDNIASPANIAVLGTDLWLESDSGKSVSHMPDADSKTGERSDTRIIELTPRLKDASSAKRLVIVLVGVARGQAVFLKQLKGKLEKVGDHLAIAHDSFLMENLDLDVGVTFNHERLLPLLGMGETGTGATSQSDFLDKLKKSFGQVVWVEKFGDPTYDAGTREVCGRLVLGIKAAGVQTKVNLGLVLALDTMRVRFESPSQFNLKSRRIEEDVLGLTWVIEQTEEKDRASNAEVEMFTLSFVDGESGFGLNLKKARMELRFAGLSSDGVGIVFKVTEFFVGRRGVDIMATVDDRAVRLNGLDVPFRFQKGSFKMSAGKLVEATISGRGTLPPALVGDADCTLDLAFAQDASGIVVLQSGKVEIDKKGEAIVCHSTRFTLTISDLDVGIQKDGGYHFYLLVTGSLRFTPKDGEFEGGLLGFLKDIDINLERTPLTGDARVLAKHVSFQKALNPKKSFSLFNLFTFELRGFGFHPSSDRFDGQPAINLSGQIKFADIGDVMQPKIDFHGLWIAPPKSGEALPRISAEGLGLDLQLAGSVKIRGSVLAVDPSTRTVEGKEFAPAGYNTYGFLGEGEVDIPGWGSMQASLGFLEIEKKDRPGERRKAFFVYLQKDKLAVEIPTGFWNFYMREAGLGFGFRYTLAGIRGADEAKTPAQLIRVLDDVSKRQGDLARYSAWSPDPEGDRFTLALRAAIQAYPAQKNYIDKDEEVAQNPFFFDMIVALRSDLTLLASMRGWLGVNYADFRANKDNFRERPGLRGYLYISAPRSELLARMVGDSKGFIGERFPGLQTGEVLRRAVESVDWSATLYIRPGLFHYELGWPDQLAVRLVDSPNMKVNLRGGMIFRAADDGLLWGYNIEADAWLSFGGSTGGSIGVSLEAVLQARFVARLIAYLSWCFSGSMVYGLVMLDASLTFRVRAWMEVDLGFKSFTIRIGFSYSVQFSAAIEMAVTTSGVGGRGYARLAVSAFGCTLSVGVGFAFNDSTLEVARARVQRFMAMSITADEPDTPPALATKLGDQRIDASAKVEEQKAQPMHRPEVVSRPADSGLKPSKTYPSGAGRPIDRTNFWLVLHEARPPETDAIVGSTYAYALLVPRDVEDKDENQPGGAFYASPLCDHDVGLGFSYQLQFSDIDGLAGTSRIDFHGNKVAIDAALQRVQARWYSKIPVDTEGVEFRLDQLFDECFLTDTEWEKVKDGQPRRLSLRRQEPKRARSYTRDSKATHKNEATRAADREQAQRQQAADAAQYPSDDRAYQARSTVMSMFLDQFESFAKTGKRPAPDEAHVLDLGLVFYGPVEQLETLATRLEVLKHDQTQPKPGNVKVLNPSSGWFYRQDPTFTHARTQIGSNGLCMDWDLSLPWREDYHPDPDQFLLYYEICRTIEGRGYEPRLVQVKPAATMGQSEDSGALTKVCLHPADWQYSDDFADLPADWRRALLPTSNESDALLAARAWVALQLSDDVTITYAVTPVDIAGTRGLSKSFVHTVERPSPPVRAAEAEIRVVQTLVSDADVNADERENGLRRQQTVNAPDDIEVYIAMRDPAWTKTPQIQGHTVKRFYTLVIEQERVLPAGSYASGGATDKVRGLGSAGAEAASDSMRFEFQFGDLTLVRLEPTTANEEKILARVLGLEPDKDTLKRLDLWGALVTGDRGWKSVLGAAKGKRLLNALWSTADSNSPQRIAARFWLRTSIEVFDDTREQIVYTMESRLVPVPCELTMEHRRRRIDADGKIKTDPVDLTSIRPEVFEWPVHLRLPPLVHRQVRVRAGFLHLRMPSEQASLAGWVESPKASVVVLRDAERRTVSHLAFDAVPHWQDENVAPLHLSSVAGFDLHELDIDDLATLDTEPKWLARDPGAWKRARRVAHIELLSPEEASLVPSSNADWLGWQAHYPSETWRTMRDDSGAPRKGAQPVRRAWYSPRESTPRFPDRLPRRRLLPLPPESAVIDLMRSGMPMGIKAVFTVTADSPAAKTPGDQLSGLKVNLCLPMIKDADVAETHPVILDESGFFKVRAGEPFTASALRYLLLCLCWSGPDEKTLHHWQLNPAAFDGLNLELSAYVNLKDVEPKVTLSIPLDLKSPIHPILEETLAELALRQQAEFHGVPAVYRAYNVMVQPAPQVDARELANYLAASPASTDPYGWGVLQGLGLSATIRLYDTAQGRFLSASEVADQVNFVFNGVLGRWQSLIGTSVQPFAEVLLKPGCNRVLRPFDAKASASQQSNDFLVDDDGLAMMQLSLRPVPEMVWQYSVLEFDTSRCVTKVTQGAAEGETSTLQRISLQLKRAQGETAVDKIDLIDPATGNSVTLDMKDDAIAMLDLPLAFGRKDPPMLLLAVRFAPSRNDFTGVVMSYELLIERIKPDGTSSKRIRKVSSCLARIKAIDRPGHPDDESAGTSVFELFANQPVDAWAYEMRKLNRQFKSLLAYLRAVAPGFKDPNVDRDYPSLMAQYPQWAQRLLDHGTAPGNDKTDGFGVSLALAAPTKANPLRLAPDASGCVRLYIPSDDRWGHARAYAIKPVSRYAHLMASIGVLPGDERELLVTPGMEDQEIGHAIAVVPRTERIEPPVILGSSIQDNAWEIVLARHGEESLAASNRTLFARLGKPDVVLAQLRAYRTPAWPDKLESDFKINPPSLYLARAAKHPSARPGWEPLKPTEEPIPGELRRLRRERLAELAEQIPCLWKGADVASFRPVPPQYKVLALAAARAGIVVSNLVSVLQDDLPRKQLRKLPDTDADALAPELKLLISSNNKTVYELTHRLVSHHDLTPEFAREWNAGDPKDVCWWPDPDVSYLLLHHAKSGDMRVSEELSDIRLVAEDPSTKAVAVRTRGTRWVSTDSHIVQISSGGQPPSFHIEVTFGPVPQGPADGSMSVRLSSTDVQHPQAAAFEQTIRRIGLVLVPYQRRFGLAPGDGETGSPQADAGYEERIRAFATQCKARVTALTAIKRFDVTLLVRDCEVAGKKVDDWLITNGADLGLAARFQQAIQTGGELAELASDSALRYWPKPDPQSPAAWLSAPLVLTAVEADDMPPVLVLWDIPADVDLSNIKATRHPLARRKSKFWQVVVQRIRSGATHLELKAIDARAKQPTDQSVTEHPGVKAADVQWPTMVKMID
jgi:hypothetical protein